MSLLLALVLCAPQDGAKAFQRCAECHAVPDPSIRADQLWTEMINGSA